MSQTVAGTCVLGPGQTGLAIGLRVLNLDGTTYSAFSTTGVAETLVLGTYRKANGVVVSDAGGYIVWGTAATDKAEATVEAAALAGIVEGTLTLEQVLRVILAGLVGKTTGGGTSSVSFRDVADTKNRIAATVDANRNRTAVTLDGS
jgi:hypothetical protein